LVQGESPLTERGCLSRSAWRDRVASEFARTVLVERRGREKFKAARSGGTLRLRQPRSARRQAIWTAGVFADGHPRGATPLWLKTPPDSRVEKRRRRCALPAQSK